MDFPLLSRTLQPGDQHELACGARITLAVSCCSSLEALNSMCKGSRSIVSAFQSANRGPNESTGDCLRLRNDHSEACESWQTGQLRPKLRPAVIVLEGVGIQVSGEPATWPWRRSAPHAA